MSSAPPRTTALPWEREKLHFGCRCASCARSPASAMMGRQYERVAVVVRATSPQGQRPQGAIFTPAGPKSHARARAFFFDPVDVTGFRCARDTPPPRRSTRGAPPVASWLTSTRPRLNAPRISDAGTPSTPSTRSTRRRQSHKGGTRSQQRHYAPRHAKARDATHTATNSSSRNFDTPPARFHAPCLPTPQTPKYRRPFWR